MIFTKGHAMEWQPIATAPRDGTAVILFMLDTGTTEDVGIGAWGEFRDGDFCWCMDTGDGWAEPTFWAPIELPKSKL